MIATTGDGRWTVGPPCPDVLTLAVSAVGVVMWRCGDVAVCASPPAAGARRRLQVKATEKDDVFHFVAYVPYGGSVYELDGLKVGNVM